MKLVKYPARAVVIKIICDCEQGELVYKTTTAEGLLHKCTNEECGIEVLLTQQFPTTGAEIINATVEELVKPEEKVEEIPQQSGPLKE
jgi:hypothetical protein